MAVKRIKSRTVRKGPSEKSKEENAIEFQKFMLEEQYWTVIDGQLTENVAKGFYSLEDIKLKFEQWKRKK